MAADDLRNLCWGRPGVFTRADRMETRRILNSRERFFWATDKDGGSLEPLGLGSPRLVNCMQQEVWRSVVEPLFRRKPAQPDARGDLWSALVTWRDGYTAVEKNPPLPIVAITREKLQRTDFLPEDLIDITDIATPLLRSKPANYVFVFQLGHLRGIVGNLRAGRSQWNEWPAEETRWFLERFADFNLLWLYGHVPSLIAKLTEHDVPFTVGVKPGPMAKVMEAARQGDDLNPALEEAFKDYPWEEVMDEWRMNPDWNKRMTLFQDAVTCLRSGGVGGAVVEILAQLEGVVMQYLMRHKKGLNSEGKALGWKTRVDQLEVLLAGEAKFGPVRRLMVTTTLTYLRDSGLYEDFTWSKEGTTFSRHRILHGNASNYATKSNAIRALLAVDALYWVTGFQFRVDPEKKPGRRDVGSGERWPAQTG